MKMENHILNTNTILHTKDGSKIGNAIVTGREGFYWEITTDYGNKVKLTSEKIDEYFNIAWSNISKEIDGLSCQEMQEMMSDTHKHRVTNFKIRGKKDSKNCITNINENNIIEAICLAEKVIEILDKKCRKGCTNSAWIGFQNGEGTECGIDIEHLIKQAKQFVADFEKTKH